MEQEPQFLVVMGVAGSGKTSVGRAVAERLGWPFYDADSYHDQDSIDKMSRGLALTDADRWPWLEQLQRLTKDVLRRRESAVLACSALKQTYRKILRVSSAVQFAYLKADRATLAARLAHRKGHYAGVSLLDSQLADLEPPRDAWVFDATQPIETVANAIVERATRGTTPAV